MLIIPAIDIINNKVVRLSEGDYNKTTVYENTPVNQAQIYSQYGFEWIHIVDLLASKSGGINIAEIILSIKNLCNIKIEFGGGIRTLKDVDKLFEIGIDKVILGSISINNKSEFEKIVNKYGEEKIITAVDVSNEFVAIKGWTEKSLVHIYEHINYCISLGLKTFLCTDISKDGLLKGPNFNLYKKLQNEFNNINIIASGGISCTDDIIKLNEMQMHAAVIGRAIYENKINLKELAELAD